METNISKLRNLLSPFWTLSSIHSLDVKKGKLENIIVDCTKQCEINKPKIEALLSIIEGEQKVDPEIAKAVDENFFDWLAYADVYIHEYNYEKGTMTLTTPRLEKTSVYIKVKDPLDEKGGVYKIRFNIVSASEYETEYNVDINYMSSYVNALFQRTLSKNPTLAGCKLFLNE